MMRKTMQLAIGGLLIAAFCAPTLADHHKKGEKKDKAQARYKVKDIHGKEVNLAKKYKGKVMLIVNVASKCGATPQYEDLEALHDKYSDAGLAVLGFPCNQFGSQEPGTEKQILEFCQSTYNVEFDMFSKIDVNGDDAAPLYKYLTGDKTGLSKKDQGKVKWNFEKFLIGRDGKVIARYRTRTNPRSDEVVSAIEKALKAEKKG